MSSWVKTASGKAEFAEALTSDLVGDGVQTLALEVSPNAGRQLSLQLASPDPSQSFAFFLQQYPVTVPFYNTAEEFDFLRHTKARIGTSFSLIGFDQEFLGSGKFLLQKAGEQALTDVFVRNSTSSRNRNGRRMLGQHAVASMKISSRDSPKAFSSGSPQVPLAPDSPVFRLTAEQI